LDGQGAAEPFADYSQWEVWQSQQRQAGKTTNNRDGRPKDAGALQPQAQSRKKLSYLEARDYEVIEGRVAKAEEILQAKREQLDDPAIASDGPKLLAAHAQLDAAQKVVDELYARWAELEKKKG
jgi:ATP-binding cassette subfamily F protein uup